ncbi:MAG: LacI family transcriptional regulator, partial [Lactobacillus sp.]|nr:LacI family transcriptional regulator [Lactobacillus sp.]
MRDIATIKDIAKKANVSPSTVSRALNGNSRISEETVTKIKKMASEMGYYPNYAAQNLTRGDANIVGIVFPVTSKDAPANPFHIDLMRGVSSALSPMHYEMLVAISATEKELLSSVKSMVNQAKVHNFLIFYAVKDDPITAYLRKKKLNFVIIGDPSDNSGDR